METHTQSVDPAVINKDFKAFILETQHPCVMAKSVFKMNNYDLHAYDDMHSADGISALLSDLETYLEGASKIDSMNFRSFVAVFPNNKFDDEISFENALWQTLQKLHEADDAPWDKSVSKDPNDAEFSFSLLGKAFYVIGMHPKSSRMARQSPYTAMVFNLHFQFEKLRAMGTYQNVRDMIRKNDEKLQGSINPILKDFGDDSESKQYSGRNVESAWKCPFHHKHN